jgi:endoglucanase
MKIKWLPVVFSIVIVCQVNAALKLQEVRTASNTVLVVYFESTIVNASEVNTADLSLWTINGQPATAINKYVMQADGCDHYIYLTVPQLVNDAKYDIKTPYGDTSIVFDDHAIFCESIKTNQAAYSSLCKSNYALFAVWLGDGGKKQINGDLPSYEVFEVYTGTVVAQGTLGQAVTDASTGESVHRINLSAVPEGGPYKIAVAGYGCSYPFGIGCDFSRRLAHIMFRAQYHQRCGCR